MEHNVANVIAMIILMGMTYLTTKAIKKSSMTTLQALYIVSTIAFVLASFLLYVVFHIIPPI